MPQTLRDDFNTLWRYGVIPKDLPEYTTQNLNPAFPLRPYQREALGRFFYYLNGFPERKYPTQLLFHMATGSGKTLIMAAAILYLYEQGYRNFIFFVNSTNIIEKTRENFLNPLSFKYLFAERLKFGAKEVHIREVGNFESAYEDDIRVLFTTIQGLHIRLNEPRENSLTYEDFTDKDIVLISDEAHHINALTKRKLTKTEAEELNTWEATVNRIFNSRSNNILLEFTATVELDHPAVAAKYADKIIYQYDLKQFREDGYSKEVKVLQADLLPIERALQAVVLSQYRRKVAEKHGIPLKPVLLMKSSKIAESEAHATAFVERIASLTGADLQKIKEQTQAEVIQNAFAYFDAQGISLDNLAAELREEFAPKRCLTVNSKSDSEEKQILINSLEDSDNQIRVIFAVDKLNEGWDVLNLYDIVRLYNTRDAKRGTPGKTTISEAQLIGRGARYFPFQVDETQPRDRRKFDDDLDNELRILEELYYHSAHNPRYIDELHTALVQTGIVPPRKREIHLRVKESFKETDFWENGVIFVNKRVRTDRTGIFGFADIAITQRHSYRLRTGYAAETAILEETETQANETVTQAYALYDFGVHVIRKALNKLDFYRFSNLKQFFPHLKSIDELIRSEAYLRQVIVDISGTSAQVQNLSPEDKLRIAIAVLQQISKEIQTGMPEYEGTKVFEPLAIRYCVKDKMLQIALNEGSDKEFGVGMRETSNLALQLDLSDKAWYVYDENYGTSEEKHFVRFIHSAIPKLKEKYAEIYLLRNAKLFQIYRFSDGAALEPDFVLFAIENQTRKAIIYQLFIEAKGSQLLEKDKWKEEFLQEIEREAKVQVLFQNKEYSLIGMPFYNETVKKTGFEKKFNEVLLK